jgi:RimJ/RimL family protein N-acetyltransferase
MRLPPDVLARRGTLPLKPAPVVLTGTTIALRPCELARDLDALHAITCGAPSRLGGRTLPAYDPDERIWRHMAAGPFADAAALGAWLGRHLDAADERTLTVVDLASGAPIGVVTFMANAPAHLKLELGRIWYGAIAQGTAASTEATALMLGHAFALGYRRVEWKCDTRNARSGRAALAYGFTFEGVQQAHYIIKDQNRDTAWYRMLDHEWPEVSLRLAARVASRVGTSTM